MRINTKWLGKLFFAGTLVVLGSIAQASVQDATLLIDHALNSPTLTVRYSGAHVALVELRLNGTSYGTRNMDVGPSKGETDFTIDVAALNDGDNSVEVRLYDKSGKLLAAETRTVTADEGHKSPIYLQSPRIGSTVQGPVEISVGFGRNLHNTYVSFFVDNQFKAMTNTPPYSYVWDTTHDANGWHEIEAWAVDDSSITYKTRRVKVYVNNPGGNTAREFLQPDGGAIVPPATKLALDPMNSQAAVTLAGAPSGTRAAQLGSTAAVGSQMSALRPLISTHVARRLTTVPITNQLVGVVAPPAGVKPQPWAKAVATGPQLLLPTGTRMAVPLVPAKAALTGPISSVPHKVHTMKAFAASKSLPVLPAIEDSAVVLPKAPEVVKTSKVAAVKVETPRVARTKALPAATAGTIQVSVSKPAISTSKPDLALHELGAASKPLPLLATKTSSVVPKAEVSVPKPKLATTEAAVRASKAAAVAPKLAVAASPKTSLPEVGMIVDMPVAEVPYDVPATPKVSSAPKVPKTSSVPKPLKVRPSAKLAKLGSAAKIAKSATAAVSHSIASASKAAYIPVGHGTKIPHVGTYSIVLNSRKVNFDAAKPRVENKVPLTPFRYLFEDDGGKVNWEHKTKTVYAERPSKEIYIKIGDKLAKVNNLPIEMDLTPFIDHGRTIVPLSFIKDALDVEIDYDPITGHVLITSIKKKH